MKTKEKEKIVKLNPQRYLLVTSVGLAPTDKERIKRELSPYILCTNDIYGADDLNGLLIKYPDVEKKYYKLWFSNTNIIQKIVNNGIDGRSAFIEDKIKKNIGLYVINQSFKDALAILEKQKVLMITGIPGIGKTTLANLITYDLLSNDFRLVCIDDKIKDAEDVFDNDSNVKQLFYFDDFLGSNYLEIITLRNSESSIVNFIERIQATKNKYLILTTRSTILNQAKSSREKLNRANLDSLKYELEITNYKEYDKARILYNHLYFSNLDIEMIDETFRNKNYWEIIRHKNYNPRLIEYFTKEQNINHLTPGNYFNFIISSLNNPEEIWESALTNQLNPSEKYLLFILLTLGRFVSKTNLENAFDAKIKYEVSKHGFTREINIFNISLKNLMDGYIKNTIISHTSSEKYIDFINPSLRDFLITFFNRNNAEKWKLIESFIFVDQFDHVFKNQNEQGNNVIINDSEVKKYVEIIYSKELLSTVTRDNNNIVFRKIRLIHSYKNIENTSYIYDVITSLLNEIDWSSIRTYFIDDVLRVMEQIDKMSSTFNFLLEKWDIMIEKLADAVDQESELERVKNLFEKFGFDYTEYLNNNCEFKDKVVSAVNRIFKEEANEIINQEKIDVYSEEDFGEMEQRVSDRFNDLSNVYLKEVSVEQTHFPCDEIDIESLIGDNKRISDEAELHRDDWEYSEKDNADNIEVMVDGLFSPFER